MFHIFGSIGLVEEFLVAKNIVVAILTLLVDVVVIEMFDSSFVELGHGVRIGLWGETAAPGGVMIDIG